MNGAFILVGCDGDPKPGSQQDLEDPYNPDKALEEFQETSLHLWLRGHLLFLLKRSSPGGQGGGCLPRTEKQGEERVSRRGKERLIRVLEEENPANAHSLILLLGPGVLK